MSVLAAPSATALRTARRSGCAVAEAPVDPASHAHGAAVLLVEDDPEIRAIFTAFLRHAGYEVAAAADGLAALAALRDGDGRLDLLVTDVALPWLDGYALAGLLRARHPGLRVLFVSGDPADAPDGAVTAGTGRLAKPLTRSALLAHVQALLGPRAMQAAGV